MKDTIKTFNVCICDMQKTRGFYVFLRDHYKIAPAELTDLLRSELVNLVSAMDRFIHELLIHIQVNCLKLINVSQFL